ncbi:MAG: serine--tRNA ligase [Crocinitomicaceae bacterium]|nr:serine--tRNA ligase [Crocinitomicaceae bacterium]
MIEIQRIKENRAEVIDGLKKRGLDSEKDVEKILKVDQQWREAKTELQETSASLNTISKEVGKLFSSGERDQAEEMKIQSVALKKQEAVQKLRVDELQNELSNAIMSLPNIPRPEVPSGKDANDNELVFESGSSPKSESAPKAHWDLAKEYQLIDFELGVKVTGAGFPFYRGKGAKLQRALISFFLDEASQAGYEEFSSPLMVNEESGIGTGQLPDKEGMMYYVGGDDLYLIPTAEVPLTNMYRDTLLPNDDFSIKITGHTPCFRREAGSYGKDVRGLNRLHQFEKVEIVRIEKPENVESALKEMIDHVKSLLEKLGLQYRILKLCGGDTGFAASITYDFEVYSAGQDKWLEVSSVSQFDTFQSNRLKLRYKDANNKSKLCHTLNGSALALPRIVAALLENNQTQKGIKIPEALLPYTGFDMIN